LAPGHHAEPGLVFRGDFETGSFSQWTAGHDGGVQEVADDRIQVVTSPVAQGHYAARFEVRQGDKWRGSTGNRAELSRSTGEREGQVRWYSWWTMFDPSYPYDTTHGWQIFAQWHSDLEISQSPVQMYASGNDIGLQTVPGDADGRPLPSITWWQGPMERGRWHHFVLHVRWSSDRRRGFVELWVDGRHVLPRSAAQTLIPGYGNYLKVGLYRSDLIVPTAVLYQDGVTVTDAAHPPSVRRKGRAGPAPWFKGTRFPSAWSKGPKTGPSTPAAGDASREVLGEIP